MFPLYDDNPTEIFPLVTLLIMGVTLAVWFFIQVAASTLQISGGGGGVAFWAHIGGYVAGLALVKLFQNPALVHAKRSGALLHRRDLRGGGWW